MKRPHSFYHVVFRVLLLCGLSFLLGFAASHARAQQFDYDPLAERERGMQLYEAGEDAEAIKVLQAFIKQYRTDARAWHYLGLALARQGKRDEARKAHERSARNASALARAYVAKAEPDLQRLLLPPLKTQLTEAAERADKYLELSENSSASTLAEGRALAAELRGYLELYEKFQKEKDAAAAPLDENAVTTRPRILKKPTPEYSEEARHNKTKGHVVLFIALSEDGTIKAILPVLSLPDGLTEQAIKAARQIKFTPATKDGKPVSSFIRVEYSFNIF